MKALHSKLFWSVLVATGLSLLAQRAHATAVISVTTDSPIEFSGTFSFSPGESDEQFAIHFPWLDAVGAFPGRFVLGDNGFGMELVASNTLGFIHVDEIYPYDPIGTVYADRTGSFISTHDFMTVVDWTFSDVHWEGTTTPILAGTFDFTVVPEPSIVALGVVGTIALLIGRRLKLLQQP